MHIGILPTSPLPSLNVLLGRGFTHRFIYVSAASPLRTYSPVNCLRVLALEAITSRVVALRLGTQRPLRVLHVT
jgi:hypothetical protein